jgi:predicted GIY-YIG superfamily endonuclease
MDSNSKEIKLKFKSWISFSDILKNPKELQLPTSKCVYIFRIQTRKIERLKGKSDILYIGQTSNLRRRFVNNYAKGRGGFTTQRIHKNLVNRGYAYMVEVSWFETDDAEKIEKELLNEFEEEHYEDPVWNRQG